MKRPNLPNLPLLSQLQPVHWLALGLAALLTAGTASVLAMRLLLSSNANLPNCQVVQNLAPTERIYCADAIASKGSNQDLQSAIDVVAGIPTNEPLQDDGERRIELWARELLQRGEVAFQDGKLEDAIAIARLIPLNVAARGKAEGQVKAWQATWDQADEIYQEAQSQLETEDNKNFLATARKLLPVGNRYWATTKYQELMEQLESRQRQKANPPKAASLPVANKTDKFTDPVNQWFQDRQKDATARLEKARQLANQGDLASLRAAVTEAEEAQFNSGDYDKIQREIDDWKRQIESIEDTTYLNRAIELARQGDEAGLQAAIDQANQIFYGRQLYNKARRQIDQWNKQLATIRNQKLDEALYGKSQPGQPASGAPAGSPNSLPNLPNPR